MEGVIIGCEEKKGKGKTYQEFPTILFPLDSASR